MRNDDTERFDDEGDAGVPPPADDKGYAHGVGEDEGWSDEGERHASPPLDLSDEADDDALELGSDQYADRGSPLSQKPARRPLFSGQSETGGEGTGGVSGTSGGGVSGDGTAGGGASGAGAPAGGGSTQGSTLFERMANLSRGSSSSQDEDEDDDEDEGGSGLNIPRFLGRQNNQ